MSSISGLGSAQFVAEGDYQRPAAVSLPFVTLSKVKKAYHTPTGELLALKGIDLSINAGDYVGIIGKSGAGKTTLINMITGVDSLTSGQVIVDGISIHDLDESQRASWRGLKVGVIYQSFHLMPTMTLLDNVLLPMDLAGVFRGRQSVERAYELLDQVELVDHASKLPNAISGGQQQRVAIARALANDPPLIVADEPTGRLDSATAEVIHRIFNRLVAEGKTLIVATHDPSLESYFGRRLHLQDGEIIDDTQP